MIKGDMEIDEEDRKKILGAKEKAQEAIATLSELRALEKRVDLLAKAIEELARKVG